MKKSIETSELNEFFEKLTPGHSGSKTSGFKGGRETFEGVDWEGNTAYYIRLGGWNQYSRGYGCYIHRGALVLKDRKNYIMRRVPGTFSSFAEAWNWMVPSAVRKAWDAGKRIIRQGDVYFIESRRENYDNMPDTHKFLVDNEGFKIVSHPEHAEVALAGSFTAYRQRQISKNFGKAMIDD